MEKNLMIPRYEVIADYPNSDFVVGNVLALDEIFLQRPTYFVYGDNRKNDWCEQDFDSYPHLFRKLFWWENRDVNELPKYVKTIKAVTPKAKQGVYIVRNWAIPHGVNVGGIGLEMNLIEPATESEYTAYNTTLTT